MMRKWEDLTSMERELKSVDYKKKSMRFGQRYEVLVLVDIYNLKELKSLARSNYVKISEVQGNKSCKLTWAKELYKIKERGLNAFMVCVNRNRKHHLHGQVDVLLMIQDFI